MVVAARLADGRAPLVSLLTLRCAEKRDLLRDHLHDLMLCSFAILVLARLNAPLNRHKPAAVEIISAVFCETVEADHRKPCDSFPLLAVGLPLLVDCHRKPAEGH